MNNNFTLMMIKLYFCMLMLKYSMQDFLHRLPA